MQCPNCGATNPESANWCGQCLTRFDAPPPATAPPPAASPASLAPAAPAAPANADTSDGFRRRGERIEWACPACGEFNSIDSFNCTICGTPFAERFREEEPEPPRNWSQLLLMTAVAPGSGHLAIGRYGSGGARLSLFLGWLLGAWVLISSGGSRATAAIAPLLLGMIVVWAGSLVDLQRIQRGEEELLAGRRLLWLVVGVLMLLGVGLFAALAPAGR